MAADLGCRRVRFAGHLEESASIAILYLQPFDCKYFWHPAEFLWNPGRGLSHWRGQTWWQGISSWHLRQQQGNYISMWACLVTILDVVSFVLSRQLGLVLYPHDDMLAWPLRSVSYAILQREQSLRLVRSACCLLQRSMSARNNASGIFICSLVVVVD